MGKQVGLDPKQMQMQIKTVVPAPHLALLSELAPEATSNTHCANRTSTAPLVCGLSVFVLGSCLFLQRFAPLDECWVLCVLLVQLTQAHAEHGVGRHASGPLLLLACLCVSTLLALAGLAVGQSRCSASSRGYIVAAGWVAEGERAADCEQGLLGGKLGDACGESLWM